jgi:hypothetical protein
MTMLQTHPVRSHTTRTGRVRLDFDTANRRGDTPESAYLRRWFFCQASRYNDLLATIDMAHGRAGAGGGRRRRVTRGSRS